jgi:hypothetical protein
MESEGSLPHTQVPATNPYPEPDQSSPRLPIPLFEAHIPCAECQIHFPLLVLYQRIIPSPKLCEVFCNIVKCLRWGVVSTSPNPQAGGPPLTVCLRLLIQYIRSYPPYLEAVPPTASWGAPWCGDRDPHIVVCGWAFLIKQISSIRVSCKAEISVDRHIQHNSSHLSVMPCRWRFRRIVLHLLSEAVEEE